MGQHKILCEPGGLAVLDTSAYEYPNWRIINRLNVPEAHRRKGIATELMQRECDDANLNGTTLILQVAPSGGMDFDQLVAFYRKFGFRTHQQSGMMIRRPR